MQICEQSILNSERSTVKYNTVKYSTVKYSESASAVYPPLPALQAQVQVQAHLPLQ